ncbi:MAG: flagellar hook-associated protein FlgL [Synergistaceae bacterium]|jgi:flagellin-like hook-associated protein FlgL|nr:flagellar hook-associated protein FlgL [Synergistaceae bacterium]
MISRVSTPMIYRSFTGALQSNLQALLDLQRQLATGNVYSKLSDNPAAISKMLDLQSTITSTETYVATQNTAISMLKLSETAIDSAINTVQEIRTLVIQAGDGGLDATALEAIAVQIEALEDELLNTLNTQVAGKYLFGGTDTTTPPFVRDANGNVRYTGSDERMRYMIEQGVLGDVSFTGAEILPSDSNSYFICSEYVPLDWSWTGREEKVQITVGDRTLSVFIPEEWIDEVTTGTTKPTDYNQFRDPDEVSGLSLDDLATLVNRALTEQGADMLVKAKVEKNYDSGQQRLLFESVTGEPIYVTGWPTTDYIAMPQTVTGETILGIPNWNSTTNPSSGNGLMGSVSTLGWKGTAAGGTISISLSGGAPQNFTLSNYNSITDLVSDINSKIATSNGEPFAAVESGRLVLHSDMDTIAVTGTAQGMTELFGPAYAGGINSSTSSLSIQIGDNHPIKVYINAGDNLTTIADRINAIEGVYARTSADGDQLVVVAQRIGNLPEDPLDVDAATENVHYPSLIIRGEGEALVLFDFTTSTDPNTGVVTGEIASEAETRQVDHSHMDVFDYLGMETALKSVQFKQGQTLNVTSELHWRVMSGSRVFDIKLPPGQYTMEQLADRLKNAGAGWLEVTVDVSRTSQLNMDDTEDGLGTSYNFEEATSRLVIRSTEGQPVVFMDMNASRYAEEMGLSLALRTDPDMGVDNIVLPGAPCVDDNLPAMVRVQKTCGMAFDIRLVPSEIKNADGTISRVKVMQQIADQTNAQAGYEMLKVVIPVDANGKALPDSASLVSVTGEPFEVVDLPISDPNWNTYTAGIAAQMGIHGGITSLLPVTDDEPMGVTGAIRFETTGGRSVVIDVVATDTAKDIMDRLRNQAGDWLYVNYFDPRMGSINGQQGDNPIVAIAAKDGSAVNVIDVTGTVAQDKLMMETGIQGDKTFFDVNGDLDLTVWNIPVGTPSTGLTFSITVDGYTHTIDLTSMRDINNNGVMDAEDLVATINSRMQDYDVKAELNEDGMFVLWSPRGYRIEIGGPNAPAATDVSNFFTGTAATTNQYRGGYDLDNPLNNNASIPDRVSPTNSNYMQNVTTRSGSNVTKQNFFGVLDNIAAAIRSENRDGLLDKLLPQIDSFLDSLLRIQSTNGALQVRYESNIERMELDEITLSETYQNLAKVDITQITTELMLAQTLYQATLGVIAQIVQPTLLDFLR